MQNWYAGDKSGKGGILNLVTKRGVCEGHKSKISWTQVETGSAVTWKYPSCILKGTESVGEFYSVALTNNMQQAARVSDFTAFMYLGELVEFGATDKIFVKPQRKETEDYITGRFG